MTKTEFLKKEILERTGYNDVMDVPMERYNHNDADLINIKRLAGSIRMHSMRIKDNKYADARSKLALSVKLP